VTNNVSFANTGTLALGDAAADTLTFTGGLTATAPSGVTLNGQIRSAGASGVDRRLQHGCHAGGHDVDHRHDEQWRKCRGWRHHARRSHQRYGHEHAEPDAQRGHGRRDFGHRRHRRNDYVGDADHHQQQRATFSGSVATGTSVVLTNTTGNANITFNGASTTPTLTTAAQGYDLDILGGGTAVTNNVSFANTGTLALGDAAADTLTFTGGLDGDRAFECEYCWQRSHCFCGDELGRCQHRRHFDGFGYVGYDQQWGKSMANIGLGGTVDGAQTLALMAVRDIGFT
jgi:hypothetical protein